MMRIFGVILCGTVQFLSGLGCLGAVWGGLGSFNGPFSWLFSSHDDTILNLLGHA